MPDETTQSPFATAATPAPDTAPATPTAEVGDTSYLDGISSQEPLIQPCTVPGVIVAFDEKQGSTGNTYFNIAVQLYPAGAAKMSDGTTVPDGKRLSSMLFLHAKDEEKFKRTARQAKNLALALRNVPLDAASDGVYKSWPAAQKVGVINGNGVIACSTASFAPVAQWIGTKVMVQVSKGKDMDGNPRNEFALLAASTKPVERKGSR